MSTNFPEEPLLPSDWISQAEAARLRGVSRQAIAKLVRNGWIVRRGSTLHFTSQGFRETSLVREAMERLAMEYCEVISKEVSRLPAGLDSAR